MLSFPESRTFEMKCQRVYAVVLILVLIPSILVVGFIFLLTSIPAVLPDWLVLTSSFLLVGLSAVLTLLAIMKWANLPCSVTLNEDGVIVSLKRRSPFFRKWVYTCSWREIRAVSSNFDSQTGGRFYKLGMRSGDGNIYLSPDEKTNTPVLETEFGSVLMQFVEVAEQLPDKKLQPIDKKNFYQSTWAYWLTRVVLVLNIVLWGVFIFADESMDAWQVTRFSLFSGVWLTAYYLNKGK